MLARVNSGALVGVEALPVQVEVNSGERGEQKLSSWVFPTQP